MEVAVAEVKTETKDDLFSKGWTADETTKGQPTEKKAEPEDEKVETKSPEGEHEEKEVEAKDEEGKKAEEKSVEAEKKGEEGEKESEVRPEKKEKGVKGKKDDYEQKWKSQQGIVRSLNEKIFKLEKEKEEKGQAETSTKQDDHVADKKEIPPDKTKHMASMYNSFPSLKKTQEEFGDEISEAIVDVTSNLASHVESRLNQIIDVLTPIMQQRFNSDIREAHSDYEDYRDSGEMLEWIDTLPEYKQKLYKEKYYRSSAKEAIDLISEFKKEKGYVDSKTEFKKESTESAEKIKKEKELKSMTGIKDISRPIKLNQPIGKSFQSGWNME